MMVRASSSKDFHSRDRAGTKAGMRAHADPCQCGTKNFRLALEHHM
jgi:hypothetical protein